MASPYQIRELQRAVNSWNAHHAHDLLGPVHVDSVFGAKTKAVTLRTAYYFGIGQPTIREWANHATDQAIADLTDWLVHPSHFDKTHRFAAAVSKTRLATERAKRAASRVFATRKFDGVTVAGWIYPILVAARKAGISFQVTDGVRSLKEAWALWADRANNPNPVSYPGTSHHTGWKYPDGAVDIVPYAGEQSFSNFLRNHPSVARGLTWAAPNDTVHFSVPGSHHPGESSY